MEKKQSKHRRGREKRLLGRKYLQLGLSLIRGSASELTPGGTRLLRGNHDWRSPRALGGTLFCSRRVFWVKPNRDASMRGPAVRVWATGFGVFSVLKYKSLPPTFYLSITKMTDVESDVDRETGSKCPTIECQNVKTLELSIHLLSVLPYSHYSVSVQCPLSFSPLATSFLLTSPLTCSLKPPQVHAPTPQVCWSASQAS